MWLMSYCNLLKLTYNFNLALNNIVITLIGGNTMLGKLRFQRNRIALALLAFWVILQFVGCFTLNITDSLVHDHSLGNASSELLVLDKSGTHFNSNAYSNPLENDEHDGSHQSICKVKRLIHLSFLIIPLLFLIIPFILLSSGSKIKQVLNRLYLKYTQATPPINLRLCVWLK